MKNLKKFLEEVKPPEPSQEDPSMKAKEKRQMQIKKQVLLKKMQAVRAGAGADIVASHTPSGDMVEGDVHSGQGEKIQKRTKKWMDKKGQKGAPGLDAMKARTAEHKAKRGVKEEVVDEGLGMGMAATAGFNAIAAGAKAYGASQAAKGAIIGGALSGGGAVVGGALNYAASRNKNKKSDSKKKKVKEDKAFDYVVAKLKKQHGDGVLTKGDKMPQPSAAQKKKNAAIRAKRAKEDHRDPTEKASDGRYSDRHSNRGSD